MKNKNSCKVDSETNKEKQVLIDNYKDFLCKKNVEREEHDCSTIMKNELSIFEVTRCHYVDGYMLLDI